jgi:hypothetical protein
LTSVNDLRIRQWKEVVIGKEAFASGDAGTDRGDFRTRLVPAPERDQPSKFGKILIAGVAPIGSSTSAAIVLL